MPRCGTLVVLIDLAAGALRVHEAWRCRARRDAAVAALVDLDAEDRPPGPDAPR